MLTYRLTYKRDEKKKVVTWNLNKRKKENKNHTSHKTRFFRCDIGNQSSDIIWMSIEPDWRHLPRLSWSWLREE